MKSKVLVAMSGGVDSSAACRILKERGCDCVGATFKRSRDDNDVARLARDACRQIGVKHYVFDFSREFRKDVKNYASREYKAGRTPNPCVYCNSALKFGLLLEKAKELGCDHVATGHYARVVSGLLKEGRDKSKDQSYFLFNLTPIQLKHILLPLGGMRRSDVLALAKKKKLKACKQKSSQDICFALNIRTKSGEIALHDGTVLGGHKGISHYTVGQRKGLGIAYKEPLYVTRIDAGRNIVFVGAKSETFKGALVADGLNWIKKPGAKKFRAKAKIRYGGKLADCTVTLDSKNRAYVSFLKPQQSPTPGQAVVFYDKDTVLGGGWIREILN